MESEDQIENDKLGDLQKALAVVEGVLQYIAEEELGPTDSVLHILKHSVDVQRSATLSQLRNYLAPVEEERKRLLSAIISDMASHKEDVQIACGKGIESILGELSENERPLLFQHMHLNIFNMCSAAMPAWKSCYFALVSMLDEETILFFVLPLALNLSKDDVAAKRTVAVQLLSKAVQTISLAASDTAVIQCLSSLTADKASSVRLQLASDFIHFCTTQQHPELIQERLMLPLMRLLLDEDVKVSCAAFRTTVQLSETLDPSFLKSYVQPVLIQYVQNCPASVQEVVVAEFGRLLWNSKECFRVADENPLGGEVRIHSGNVSPRSDESTGTPRQSPRQSPRLNSDAEFLLSIYIALGGSSDDQFRRECAFNYPAVVATYEDSTHRKRLQPMLKSLCVDPNPKVRVCMAAGFHELCLLCTGGYQTLKPCLMKLLSDTSVEVRERVVKHLDKIFFAISTDMPDDERSAFFASCAPLLVQYERDIMTNWRKVEALLKVFRFFPTWFSAQQLHSQFVPILIRHLASGASALKKTVCSTLALFLKTLGSDHEKVIAIKSVRRLSVDVGQSKSAAGRIAYVDLCEQMITHFSIQFFQTFLLGALIGLQKDPVSNVRLRLAKSIVVFKSLEPLSQFLEEHLCKPLLADPDQDVSRAAEEAVAIVSEKSYKYVLATEHERQRNESDITTARIAELVLKSEAEDRVLAQQEKKNKGRPDLKSGLLKSTSPTSPGLGGKSSTKPYKKHKDGKNSSFSSVSSTN